MGQSDQKYISPQEYLRREVKALEKHEYFEGKITQRDRSCYKQVTVIMNCIFVFHGVLQDSGFHVFSSDLRILAPKITFFTYPDLSIVKGMEDLMRGRDDLLTHPFMLVEVMSPKTRNYDRGDKFQRYRTFGSLEFYLLIDQDKTYVECFEKQENGTWHLRIFKLPGQEITLAGLGMSFKVAELYKGVRFHPRISKKRGLTFIQLFKLKGLNNMKIVKKFG